MMCNINYTLLNMNIEYRICRASSYTSRIRTDLILASKDIGTYYIFIIFGSTCILDSFNSMWGSALEYNKTERWTASG